MLQPFGWKLKNQRNRVGAEILWKKMKTLKLKTYSVEELKTDELIDCSGGLKLIQLIINKDAAGYYADYYLFGIRIFRDR